MRYRRSSLCPWNPGVMIWGERTVCLVRDSTSCFFNQGGIEMRTLIAVVALALFASPAMAQRKACEELKTEIEAKIKANGVKVFSLEIVDKDAAGEGKVVGTCDGGSKKILYKRGG